MQTTVKSEGPLTARILWCGEAPGRDEIAHGRPFIGASGQIVRRTLQWAGVDVARDVRFTNAVRHNPGAFPLGVQGCTLLANYADELDAEIASMPNLRVIVACGGPSMTRLTGRRSREGTGWGIERYHNFVFHNADLPDVMSWAPGHRHLTRFPSDIVIIPVLHPAGIMRSKGRDEMTSLRRGVQKVKRALDGALSKLSFDEVIAPKVEVIDEAFRDALSQKDDSVSALANVPFFFDTEYNRESKQVHWFGFTFDGEQIFGVPWHVDYIPAITRILHHPQVTAAAHNVTADITACTLSGLGLEGVKTWCTLITHHALHPALGVGLDDAARYYIDDIQQWKDMESNDPHYNALDVAYGWAVLQGQFREAAERPVDPMPEIHARQALVPVCYEMERRGMDVDVVVQASMRDAAENQIKKSREKISDATKSTWDKRVRDAARRFHVTENKLDGLRSSRWADPCEKHPNRNGLYKPPKGCEACAATYSQVVTERNKYKLTQKRRTREKAESERWAKGFEPRNNEHLRWLLYSPDALKLPIQRTGRPPKPTANRAAIDKLATLRAVQIKKRAFAIVTDIKEVQHLEKAISTFINIPLGKDRRAHPPYKIQGTRTGRLAGGKDADEKSDNTYAFNVLNIPREWRRMYTAPDGHILVAADWRNVEGRLTAMFCKDPHYSKVLREELRGGPKVHSVNASIIYGIDPADAKQHEIELSGQKRTAYDGGKRLTHAWSYGMKPPHMTRTFNITAKEADRIDLALSEAYPMLVRWRTQLIIDVLGLWERVPGERNQRCLQPGRRYLANPFGWQLHFLGINADQANEVVAFLPQSTGAGMFTRCAPLLEQRYPIFTGTYDSFALVVPATPADVREAAEFLTTTMERTWPELEDRSFPCEVEIGYNWGAATEENPRGLKEYS